MTIPKIIHQIWIGDRKPPFNLMKSWKDNHPDFEYIFWNEDEIYKRKMEFKCIEQINNIAEIVGKVDIIRLEILYKFGGIYIDADSICIQPFDSFFLEQSAFASFENENIRGNLVATGTMGFIPNHKLCYDIIDWVASPDSTDIISKYKAWYSVGPACLTRFLDTGDYPDFMVFPSYFFLPHHFTGIKYTGHKKVYAHQEWCNTDNKYESINNAVLPYDMTEPDVWISILVSSFNTNETYIQECLLSIREQRGHFGIELVWVNDGSNDINSIILKRELSKFKQSTRFCKLIHIKNTKNKGLSYSLNKGLLLCTNELIFRMDSDDVMYPNRIEKQLEFMNNNMDCMICGTNMRMLNENKQLGTTTNHPNIIILEDYIENPRHWFMNHPTLCYRKSAILLIGNYNLSMKSDWILEDFELGLKMLKKFGKIYNIPDVLLLYRIHSNQSTQLFNTNSEMNDKCRNEMIENIINS